MTYTYWLSRVKLGIAATALTACSLNDMVSVGTDSGSDIKSLNKEYIESRAGGISLVTGSYSLLATAISDLSRSVALFTDEMTALPQSDNPGILLYLDRDARLEPDEAKAYGGLHGARTHAMQARDILSKYSDDSLSKYRGLSYMMEGFAVLMLAENFCNGVPLSQSRYGKDIEYSVGVSTQNLFTTAIKLFDSAQTAFADYPSYSPVAEVGRMRGYMGIGNLDSAYQISLSIDPSYRYHITYSPVRATTSNSIYNIRFWTDTTPIDGSSLSPLRVFEVANGEGRVGRQWFSRSPATIDPRVPIGHTGSGASIVIPAIAQPKKFIGGSPAFPLASGIEALMVRAEYLLGKSDPIWIEAINEARRQIGMADTSAPSSFQSSLDLIFNERAAWMYFEARRLGDYRRLVRQYQRDPYLVYPNGPYTKGPGWVSAYGSALVFPTPVKEYEINYKYDGCTNLNP